MLTLNIILYISFRVERINESLNDLETVISDYEVAFNRPPPACVKTTSLTEDEDGIYDDAFSLETARTGQGQDKRSSPTLLVNQGQDDEAWYDDAHSLRKECGSQGHSPRSRSPREVTDEEYDEKLYDDAFSPAVESGK